MGPQGPEGEVGPQGPPGPQGPQGLISHNVALGRPVTASSTLVNTAASNVVDNNINTTWSSNTTDVIDWLQIDLGSRYDISRVRLFWGATYASGYQILVSDDPTFATVTSTSIYTTTTGPGGVEDLTSLLQGSGRYVRINMTDHLPITAVVFKEIQVYGVPAASQLVIPAPTPTSEE